MKIQLMHKTEFNKLCKKYNKKMSECMNYVIKKDGVMWHIDVSKFTSNDNESIVNTTITPKEIIVSTTELPASTYTYNFYNRKYTKE